jgi:hypothetical protein
MLAMQDGKPVLIRLPEMDFLDDKEEKPVAIHKSVGRRTIAAFGNSDGDLQMLQWTAHGKGRRLMLLVHHPESDNGFRRRTRSTRKQDLAGNGLVGDSSSWQPKSGKTSLGRPLRFV